MPESVKTEPKVSKEVKTGKEEEKNELVSGFVECLFNKEYFRSKAFVRIMEKYYIGAVYQNKAVSLPSYDRRIC